MNPGFMITYTNILDFLSYIKLKECYKYARLFPLDGEGDQTLSLRSVQIEK